MPIVPITRTDKAYCRKWTAAHRKGKPTAEITREWLAAVRAPDKVFHSGGIVKVRPVLAGPDTEARAALLQQLRKDVVTVTCGGRSVTHRPAESMLRIIENHRNQRKRTVWARFVAALRQEAALWFGAKHQ